VAVAAVIVAFVLVPTGAPGGPSSAAATELQALASRADNIPTLAPGQYVYSAIERQIGTFAAALSPKEPSLSVNGYWSAVVKTWINAQGNGRLVVEADPTAHLYTKADETRWKAAGSPPLPGPPGGASQKATITPAEADKLIPGPTPLFVVSGLPTSRTALRRVLASNRFSNQIAASSQCKTADCRIVIKAAALLQGPDIGATPALRSTLYQVLAHVPGVRVLGTIKDEAGRPGLGLTYVERVPSQVLQLHCASGTTDANMTIGPAIPFRLSASRVAYTFVIDPKTTAVIGTHQVPSPAMQIMPPNPCAVTNAIQRGRGYNAPSWTSVLDEGIASSDS
jgi:hypothetical protein